MAASNDEADAFVQSMMDVLARLGVIEVPNLEQLEMSDEKIGPLIDSLLDASVKFEQDKLDTLASLNARLCSAYECPTAPVQLLLAEFILRKHGMPSTASTEEDGKSSWWNDMFSDNPAALNDLISIANKCSNGNGNGNAMPSQTCKSECTSSDMNGIWTAVWNQYSNTSSDKEAIDKINRNLLSKRNKDFIKGGSLHSLQVGGGFLGMLSTGLKKWSDSAAAADKKMHDKLQQMRKVMLTTRNEGQQMRSNAIGNMKTALTCTYQITAGVIATLPGLLDYVPGARHLARHYMGVKLLEHIAYGDKVAGVDGRYVEKPDFVYKDPRLSASWDILMNANWDEALYFGKMYGDPNWLPPAPVPGWTRGGSKKAVANPKRTGGHPRAAAKGASSKKQTKK